jgi:hypothetical protein
MFIAADTTPKCLAGKARAAASFRKCTIDAEAKLLEGKEANLMKCDLTFATRRAKLGAKAAKAGIQCRFLDNGDGTVTDYDTGLQWEKKNSLDGIAYLPNPHDVENTYAWGDTTTGLADGTLFTEFLGRLNGSVPQLFDVPPSVSLDGITESGGFAGHADWRLPTVAELASLIDPFAPGCGSGSPCINPIFGVVASGAYATSTSQATDLGKFWYVVFRDRLRSVDLKGDVSFAVAVRGGW